MVSWLESIGISATGDLKFITYITACVLAVFIVVIVTSCLFGIFNAIFRK